MYESITIIGRLGKDPEMKYMPSGDPVTTFNIASDRQWNGKDGSKQKETTWFRITVFGKQGEMANQYLSKGKMVLVEGRLSVDAKTGGPRVFTGQDGITRATFEVVANTVRFLSPKSESAAGSVPEGGAPAANEGGDGEGIPF